MAVAGGGVIDGSSRLETKGKSSTEMENRFELVVEGVEAASSIGMFLLHSSSPRPGISETTAERFVTDGHLRVPNT